MDICFGACTAGNTFCTSTVTEKARFRPCNGPEKTKQKTGAAKPQGFCSGLFVQFRESAAQRDHLLVQQPSFFAGSSRTILAYHFSLLFDAFIQSLPAGAPQTRTFFDRFFTFFYEQRHFVHILTRNHLTYLLEQKIEDHLQKIDLFRSTAQTAGHPEYMSAYLAGALTQMLLHWAETGYDLPARTLSRFAWKASKGDFHPQELRSALPAKASEAL